MGRESKGEVLLRWNGQNLTDINPAEIGDIIDPRQRVHIDPKTSRNGVHGIATLDGIGAIRHHAHAQSLTRINPRRSAEIVPRLQIADGGAKSARNAIQSITALHDIKGVAG